MQRPPAAGHREALVVEFLGVLERHMHAYILLLLKLRDASSHKGIVDCELDLCPEFAMCALAG